MSAPASYDLNEVADALALTFNDLPTGQTMNGVAEKVSAYSEVPEQISVPALVLELDDLSWDETMGDGQDMFSFVATVLIRHQETKGAQRALRTFLSRKVTSGVGRLKAALLVDKTLGGKVSYAHMVGARRIGLIKYGDVDYLGAELVIEVVS